jgi:hypothetical protein
MPIFVLRMWFLYVETQTDRHLNEIRIGIQLKCSYFVNICLRLYSVKARLSLQVKLAEINLIWQSHVENGAALGGLLVCAALCTKVNGPL